MRPFFWLSYIDDMLLTWTHGKGKLPQFFNDLSNLLYNLKFICKIPSCTFIFLDLNVSIRNGAIYIDLYIEPMDCHQYLLCLSSHPLQIKTSMPYSQALKVSRSCSSENDLKTHVSCMKELFLARVYP